MAAPLIELTAPDIRAHRRSATGTDYVHVIDSGRSGPNVMVNALTHGNEICGAIAVDRLLREDVKPVRGKLTLAFANIDAFERFDTRNPYSTRFVDEDLNRVWSADILEGPRDSIELRRARVLRPIVDTVDILLDVHSMQRLSAPLNLAGPTAKGRALAAKMEVPATVVSDEGHAAGIRLRDYAAFADPVSPKCAALVECGQHWKRETAAVAIESVLRFLLCLDVIDRAFAAPHLRPNPPPPQRFIEVTHAITIKEEPFVFTTAFDGLEVIEKAGTVIAHDGQREVRTPYDRCVLVMPSQRLSRGLTAVRLGRFVT